MVHLAHRPGLTVAIEFDPTGLQFHMRNDRISYVIGALEDGSLGQLHIGPPLAPGRSYRGLGGTPFHGFSNRLGEPIRLEYPSTGSGDYRIPALGVEHPDGSTVLGLRYGGHSISPGKPALPGLPATYVERDDEAETLEVLLVDDPGRLEVRLLYTIFAREPIVTRSVRFRNAGSDRIRLTCAMSAVLDLPDADWRLVQLSGTWARERHVVTRQLAQGRQSVHSQRGASSHQHNPFLALVRPATTEDAGEALGFSLVYSGNFLAEAEVDSYATTRVRIGIDPDTFRWRLEPGAEFVTPEAVLAYSSTGLGGLSDAFHRVYRERLARGTWRDRPRPVLINNWEATYFDFDETKLLEIAGVARELGVELFVLDDGWFGARDDDTTSLGDWSVNRTKLPDGLDGLAARIESLGMSFGLWVEPEMVSRESRLFREHPEWTIATPGRPSTESRQQLVLDMSRAEVVDHLATVLSDILSSAPISYVKWDMNRNITEPWSPGLPADGQGEFFHRYILGVYDLYARLTSAFPDVLFESCAGGGGRFDPGILAYAPQGWTSDQTDAIERLAIQWGTSIVYPLSSMGAHVSAVPNHQVGRSTPLSTRAAVAFFGVLGYELDPTALSETEREEVARQIAFYKDHRELLQRGRFLRLRSPFDRDGNAVAWMVASDDRRSAIVGEYRILNRAVPGPDRLPLRGLDADAVYAVAVWPPGATDPPAGTTHGGDELMTAGLVLDLSREEAARRGDFWARLYVLSAIEV